MSWNKYFIFVKRPKLTNINEILKKLRLDHYKPEKEVSADYTNKPTTLYVGLFNNNLFIVHPDLPFLFYRQTPSETEKRFTETFPDSEIAALVEDGTVSLFGYSIIDKGNRVRLLNGSEGEYHISIGNTIPEEIESIEQTTFNKEEINYMQEDGMNNEEIEKMRIFESHWRVPSLLTKRYLGKRIDQIDTDKVILTKYTSEEKDNFESSPKEKEIQNLIEHIRNLSNQIK